MEPKELRQHHYTFAHKGLREACAGHPLRFFATIASKDKDEYIRFIWSIVCEYCDPIEQTDIKPEDIQVFTTRISDLPAIIVLMPEAISMAEAHIVAIVLTDDKPTQKSPDQISFRYFTLEYGTDIQGNIQTVLGEWTDDGHLNKGEGPENDIDAFIEHLEKII